MATGPKASSKFPTVAVVIPKMEQSPSMSSNGLNNAKNTAFKESNPTVYPATGLEEQDAFSPEPVDPELLESEMELVSSLAKLQKLEDMIHQLRTLLPERLLGPLAPIVNPKATAGNTVPGSPLKLHEQLSQAVRAGSDEVGGFQAMWRGPEMKGVWDRIDTLVYENAGQLLQSSGMWERDYDTLLEDITKQDTIRKDQQQRAKEERERSQLQSAEGGWKALVDSFAQKDVPGLRVLPPKNDSSFIILLAKAGLAFKIHAIHAGQDIAVPDWQVSSKSTSGEPTSKLESAILDCLNSRSRKWDLTFLLEMISSYSKVFQTTCIECGKMQDKAANLPAFRRPKSTETSNNPQPPTFEAYHPSCL
ncbi:mediator complex subunit 27-domain-containing protein [Aspergillus cavernicola]|uniref:Mediator complex subunit 27-domain-containing protein n=1 Tax=Aspergillus cavernicola TaxID=176166 RepID=A0ABR4IXH9_9EURO